MMKKLKIYKGRGIGDISSVIRCSDAYRQEKNLLISGSNLTRELTLSCRQNSDLENEL